MGKLSMAMRISSDTMDDDADFGCAKKDGVAEKCLMSFR